MKRFLIHCFMILGAVNLISQDVEENHQQGQTQKTHVIKAGASIQYEWSGGYYYYDEYDYFYDYSYSRSASSVAYYDGPNTQVFLAYELIWTFPVRMGVSIEPKLGLSFREYLTNGFVGVNWKFYWADLGHWRMGIYLYTGYEYIRGEKTMYVSMQDGMYRKLTDLTLNQNVLSFDMGLVPFQFTPKNTPLSIELNFNILGLHVFKIRSSEYDLGNGETGRYKYTDVGGYGPRVELKLGWNIK